MRWTNAQAHRSIARFERVIRAERATLTDAAHAAVRDAAVRHEAVLHGAERSAACRPATSDESRRCLYSPRQGPQSEDSA